MTDSTAACIANKSISIGNGETTTPIHKSSLRQWLLLASTRLLEYNYKTIMEHGADVPQRAYLRPRRDAADRSHCDCDVCRDTRRRLTAVETFARTRPPPHVCVPIQVNNVKVWHLYSASSELLHFWSAQHGSHSFLHCKYTMPPLPRSSLRGATTEWTVIAPAGEAYYSFIDPVRMKGWVGLVGWPTADGLLYKWLPISCRSGADQWKFAGQRPTFYHWATKPTRKVGSASDATRLTPRPPSLIVREAWTVCQTRRS